MQAADVFMMSAAFFFPGPSVSYSLLNVYIPLRYDAFASYP